MSLFESFAEIDYCTCRLRDEFVPAQESELWAEWVVASWTVIVTGYVGIFLI